MCSALLFCHLFDAVHALPELLGDKFQLLRGPAPEELDKSVNHRVMPGRQGAEGHRNLVVLISAVSPFPVLIQSSDTPKVVAILRYRLSFCSGFLSLLYSMFAISTSGHPKRSANARLDSPFCSRTAQTRPPIVVRSVFNHLHVPIVSRQFCLSIKIFLFILYFHIDR